MRRYSGVGERHSRPRESIDQPFEVFLVERDDRRGFFDRLGRDQEVAIEAFARDDSFTTLIGPKACSSTEHARIEDKPHVLGLWSPAEPWRSVIGSRSSTFHSGSPEMSSDSHRSSIAATRLARSAISLGDAASGSFVGRGGETIDSSVTDEDRFRLVVRKDREP